MPLQLRILPTWQLWNLYLPLIHLTLLHLLTPPPPYRCTVTCTQMEEDGLLSGSTATWRWPTSQQTCSTTAHSSSPAPTWPQDDATCQKSSGSSRRRWWSWLTTTTQQSTLTRAPSTGTWTMTGQGPHCWGMWRPLLIAAQDIEIYPYQNRKMTSLEWYLTNRVMVIPTPFVVFWAAQEIAAGENVGFHHLSHPLNLLSRWPWPSTCARHKAQTQLHKKQYYSWS